MSKVDGLVLAGKAVAEIGSLVAGVALNGGNVVADLKYIPQLIADSKDVVTAVKNWQEDLVELEAMDEAGRQQVADAWKADIPTLADKTVQDVLDQGVDIISYGLEAIGYFLNAYLPKPAAA